MTPLRTVGIPVSECLVRIDLQSAVGRRQSDPTTQEATVVILRMGIDIAVRAPHQASLADERGEVIWSGHRFRTTATDLDRLWERLPSGTGPSEITIVLEPTRNAWVPLAAWFRKHGANVVLVSAERSARPARLLRQAHQERPARLGSARPAPAAAPRGPAPRAGHRTR